MDPDFTFEMYQLKQVSLSVPQFHHLESGDDESPEGLLLVPGLMGFLLVEGLEWCWQRAGPPLLCSMGLTPPLPGVGVTAEPSPVPGWCLDRVVVV